MHAYTRSSTTVSSAKGPDQTTTDASSEKPEDAYTCSCCGAALRNEDFQEPVCPKCHVVQSDTPLSRSSRPHYGDEERKRTGSRLTQQWADRGLGAGITTDATQDVNGNMLSQTQHRLTREKGWTKHRTSEQCRLDYALREIRRIGAEFELPDPELEAASRLYRKARSEGSITGRSVEGFVTACLLAAIRRSPNRIPVSEKELRFVSLADVDQIRVARSVLTVELGIEIPMMEPQTFLPRAASELSTPGHVERRALCLLETHMKGEGAYHGTSPRTLAAAAVHAAYDLENEEERPTLKALSEVFEVAKSTISTRKIKLLDSIKVEK